MTGEAVAAGGNMNGKTALVTGAGRGIGRGIALLLAVEGAKVVVADNGGGIDGTGHDAGVAQRVVSEIEAHGGTALAVEADVSDWKSAERLVGTAIDAWGHLDILVNVAGNMRPRTIVDVTEADFDLVMRVHVNGTMNTSHFAAQHWVQRRQSGRLINIASRQGIYGHPLMINYSSAKSALFGFTRSCANALVAYGVTANVIVPSAETRMVDGMDKEEVKAHQQSGRWKSEAALGTGRDPAHVAPMALYLASDRAAHVTGRVFGAEGGRYTLWTIPVEEREVKLEVKLSGPQDYSRMMDEFDKVLSAGLSTEDLFMPLSSVDEDWGRYRGRPPRWDFKTRP